MELTPQCRPKKYFYRPQRSWAKVIFSQACVKNSVHRGGGCLPQCMLRYTPPDQAEAPDQADPPRADTPPDQADHQHPPEQTPRSRHPPKQTPSFGKQTPATVYERPVCILLECILVKINSGKPKEEITRLHSSRMRTARSLTISPSMFCSRGGVPGPGGCLVPGGACSGGVGVPGPEGVGCLLQMGCPLQGGLVPGGCYPSMP